MPFYFVSLKCNQIEDCRTRYNGDADQNPRRKKFTFPACLICGDCFEVIKLVDHEILAFFMIGEFDSTKQSLYFLILITIVL